MMGSLPARPSAEVVLDAIVFRGPITLLTNVVAKTLTRSEQFLAVPAVVYCRAMGRLDGTVALITGGARGQGAAEARLFAAEGAEIWLTDVLVDEGQAVADEIGGHFRAHDVTDGEGWSAIVAEIIEASGRVDVLINNAGIFRLGGLLDTDSELWDTTIAVNQTGVYLGMKAVAPSMVEQRSGSIINISSVAGIQGAVVAYAYAATKWALRGMTRSAARELAPHQVRVNSIHPGIIDTPMLRQYDDIGLAAALEERVPMGHGATADEVAAVALFLASDDSSHCTGSEIVVDGGLTA